MSAKELASHRKRIERRTRIISKVIDRLVPLRVLLFLVGFGWLLLLPWDGLSRRTWIDENALQPGQVNVDWSWADVRFADIKLGLLEDLWRRNASSAERAEFISSQFRELGIASATQQYTFSTPTGDFAGVNAYGTFRSPRTSGAEAIVIVASWISREDEGQKRQPNLRGIATVLSLANNLRRQSVWAKDLIFLVSDSYLDGAHAWLSEYHGSSQKGLVAQPLNDPEPAGVIWTALVIDYPGHSFSHLGLFFEGTNGRLPNQDLSNSLSVISRNMGVPLVLYDHKDDQIHRGPAILQPLADLFDINLPDYVRRVRNIGRHVSYQAIGEPSGVHGLFHRYRIDAITLYTVPATGPHGFHSLGRVIESLLRTTNNLLERLHASFFFYLFTAPSEFAEFARYLPPVIILGLAASFGGLHLYVQTGWIQHEERSEKDDEDDEGKLVWHMRDRPVLEVLCIMGATHLVGIATLAIVHQAWFWALVQEADLSLAIGIVSVPSVLLLLAVGVYSFAIRPLPPTTPALLKALNLCCLGVVISVIAVANFSLSVTIAVLATVPLCLVPVRLHQPITENGSELVKLQPVLRPAAVAFVLLISPMGLLQCARSLGALYPTLTDVAISGWLRRILWEAVILKTWFVPITCAVYLPLVLQGLVVCLLPF